MAEAPTLPPLLTYEQRVAEYNDALQDRHLHKIRKLDEADHEVTTKQAKALHQLLTKKRSELNNRDEIEWRKHKGRVDQGRRHRTLRTDWFYLNFLRKILPRRVRIENYFPDYVYYFCNAMIFVSTGIKIGIACTVFSLEMLLVGIEAVVKHPMEARYIDFPLILNTKIHMTLDIMMMALTVVGFNIFYHGFTVGHWIYILAMIGFISLEGGLSYVTMGSSEDCSRIAGKTGEKLSKLVQNYYFSLPGVEAEGREVFNEDGSPFMIRNYVDSNIMDKIQRQGGCCGSSGFKDYFVKPNDAPPLWKAEVPQSCCTPLWSLNEYCAKEMPKNPVELGLKINQEGCTNRVLHLCENAHYMHAEGSVQLAIFHLCLFLIICMTIAYQLRQIRQLARPSHFNIPADAAQKSLPVGQVLTQKPRRIEAMSLNPEDMDLSDDILKAIQRIRKELGLDVLGKHIKEYQLQLQKQTIDVAELPYVPEDQVDVMQQFTIQKNKKLNIPDTMTTRLDMFGLEKFQPYYKGMFSSTYNQENTAVKEKMFKELKNTAETYYRSNRRERREEDPADKVDSLYTRLKKRVNYSKPIGYTFEGKKKDSTMKVVVKKKKAVANPSRGTIKASSMSVIEDKIQEQ